MYLLIYFFVSSAISLAGRALSKLVSSTDLNKLGGGEEKDLEKEEIAAIQAATATTTFSEMQMTFG